MVLVRLHVGHRTKKLAQPEGENTHRWTVFVRSLGPEEFVDNNFIRKVVFRLHESFENNEVTVKQPPFEVSRNGWGGFMIGIDLKFAGVQKVYSLNFDLNFSLTEDSEEVLMYTLDVQHYPKGFEEQVQRYCRKDKAHDKPHSRPSSTNPWTDSASSSKDSSRNRKPSDAAASARVHSPAASASTTERGKDKPTDKPKMKKRQTEKGADVTRTTTPIPPKFVAPRKDEKALKEKTDTSPAEPAQSADTNAESRKTQKHKPAEKKQRTFTDDIESLFEDKPQKTFEGKTDSRKATDKDKKEASKQRTAEGEREERSKAKKLQQSKEHKSERRDHEERQKSRSSSEKPTEKSIKIKIPSQSKHPGESRVEKTARSEEANDRGPTPTDKGDRIRKSDEGSRKRLAEKEQPLSPPEPKLARPPSAASSSQPPATLSSRPSSVMNLPRIPKKEPKDVADKPAESLPRPSANSSASIAKPAVKRELDDFTERSGSKLEPISSNSLVVLSNTVKMERLSPIPPVSASLSPTFTSNSSAMSISPTIEISIEEQRRKLEESLPSLNNAVQLYRCCKIIVDTIRENVYMDDDLESMECDLSKLPDDIVHKLYKMLL